MAKGSKNRNIGDYFGYLELSVAKTIENHRIMLTGRKKSGRIDWYIYDIFGKGGDFYWMFQYFNGYGDSMENYDRHEEVIRGGFAFTY